MLLNVIDYSSSGVVVRAIAELTRSFKILQMLTMFISTIRLQCSKMSGHPGAGQPDSI